VRGRCLLLSVLWLRMSYHSMPCSSDAPSQIRHARGETELLLQIASLFKFYDPDVIMGHNVMQFSIPLILNRFSAARGAAQTKVGGASSLSLSRFLPLCVVETPAALPLRRLMRYQWAALGRLTQKRIPKITERLKLAAARQATAGRLVCDT
jgi:hypothetical protein